MLTLLVILFHKPACIVNISRNHEITTKMVASKKQTALMNAYSFANGLQGDYGMEAIETLLKRMEDDRSDMIVITAGYPELMERLIASNPGLRSRFSKKIVFPDYTPDELLEIFKYMLKNQKFTAADEAIDFVYKNLEKKYENRDENFANAREVRNFFEAAIESQADRLYGKENLSDEELCKLEIDDFQYNEVQPSLSSYSKN